MNFWSVSHHAFIYFCMISTATARFLTGKKFTTISGTTHPCSTPATDPKISANILAATSATAWVLATRTALSSSFIWVSASSPARLSQLCCALYHHHARQPALCFQAALYCLTGYGYLSDCRLYTINHFETTVYMVALLPDFYLYSMSSDTTPTR